jgi:hypothetical protein
VHQWNFMIWLERKQYVQCVLLMYLMARLRIVIV